MATILIACGGTGGHLFPGIAVADALRARGHEVVLIVSSKAIDGVALEGRPEYRVQTLPAVGWPGWGVRVGGFAVKMVRSVKACRKLFAAHRPDAVLGMGGFTSAVPLLLGKWRGLPTFVHESNAVPGRVTRLAARLSARALVGIEECGARLPRSKARWTGTPIRAELVRVDRAAAAKALGVDANRKTILVMGGSQGARGLNELVLRALPLWNAQHDEWQFLHLAGRADASLVETNYRRLGFKALVRPFASDMQHWYSLADVAISRAGAASLAELAHYGLPSVLVPFPQAADNHQRYNAQAFVNAGAAVMFAQEKLEPEVLAKEISAILQSGERRRTMSEAAHKLAMPAAANQIVQEIEACLKN